MRQRYGLMAGVILAAAGLSESRPVQSSARVAPKETPEERHRREIAQWNADLEAAKRGKKGGRR